MANRVEKNNIVGGIIPKIRIERVTLSNGGSLIREDNPHIVEDLSNVSFGIDEKTASAVDDWYDIDSTEISIARKRGYVNKAWNDITSEATARAFAYTDAKQLFELIGRSEPVSEVERLKRQYVQNISVSNLTKEFLAQTPAAKKYDGMVKFSNGLGAQSMKSSVLSSKVTSYALVDGVQQKDELKGSTLREEDLLYNLDILQKWLKSPDMSINYGPHPLRAKRSQRKGGSKKISLVSLKDSPNLVYQSLNPTVGQSRYIAQDFTVTVLNNSFVPFLHTLYKKALNLYLNDLTQEKKALKRAAKVNAVQLDPRNVEAVGASQMTTVSLLLNVSSVSTADGGMSSWMSDRNIVDNLEFLVVSSTEAEQIKNIKKALKESSKDKLNKYVQYSNLLDINLNAPEDLKAGFIDLKNELKTKKTTVRKFNLGDKLQTSVAGLQREYTIDNDGDKIYEFNFNVDFKYANDPQNLVFFIVPFLNLSSFLKDLDDKSSTPIPLNLDDFTKYLDYFIGKITTDTVIDNGTIQSTGVVYVDAATGAQWMGEVHYHGTDNLGPEGYVGWMAGERHNPRVAQPRLNIVHVPNNKIQDNRRVERLEDFERDLSASNITAFNPPVNIQNFDLAQPGNAYFSEVHLTQNVDNIISMFFGINMESIIKRDTIFGSIYQNLTLDEKQELINNLEFNSFKIVRRQVRTALDQNRLGGLSADLDNISSREYQEPDHVVVSTNERGIQVFEGSEGSAEEVSSFMENLRGNLRTNYSSQKFFGQTRFFTAKDKTSPSLIGGKYQYGIKLEILDKTLSFLGKRKTDLEKKLDYLNEYYVGIMDNTNYNFATDTISKDYVRAFKGEEVKRNISYTPTQNNPHIMSAVTTNTDSRISIAAEGLQSYMLKVSPNVRKIVSDLSNKNGTFINSLRMLSSNINTFNADQVSLTVKNYLNPNTASRESVLRMINLISNLVTKIERLMGVNLVPPTSQTAQQLKTSTGKKTVKLVYLSNFSSNIFDASIPRGNGYYYIPPPIGEELQAADNGIRRINGALYDLVVKQEVEKSFYDPGVRPTTELDFLTGQKYSYLSPRLICLAKAGPNADPNNVRLDLGSRNDLIVFPHKYNIETSAPSFEKSISEYNLLTSRIRTFNDLKKSTAIPVVTGADYGEYSLFANITKAKLLKGGQAMKASLQTSMATRNCTIFTADSYNNLLNRSVRGVIDTLGDKSPPEQQRVTAADLFGFASKFIPKIDLDVVLRLGQNSYKQSHRIPTHSNFTRVVNSVLNMEATYLTPQKLNTILTSDEAKKGFISSFSSGHYRKLPTQLKVLYPPSPKTSTMVNRLNTLGTNLQNPLYSGIMDIHINKVMQVQVLNGYETNAVGELLLDRPIWKKLEASDLNANILCRLVPYTNSHLHVGHPEYLEMPVFDRLFFVAGKEVSNEVVNKISDNLVPDRVTDNNTLTQDPKYVRTGLL